MQLLPLLPALLLTMAAGWAVGADPQSAGCQRALETLRARENALLATLPRDAQPDAAAVASIEPLRRQAARACLGGTGERQTPKQVATPPVAMPSAAVPPARAPRPAAPANAAPAPRTPKRAEPPVFISACDADACWASDGARLPRSGNQLVGPRGLCAGSVGQPLRCP